MAEFAGFNEMQALREALGLTQAQMGEALGIEPKNAQGTWRRWESDPTKPAARRAFEKAKEVYQQRMREPWKTPIEVPVGHKGTYPIQGHSAGQAGATGSLGAYATASEVGLMIGKVEGRLEEKISRLERRLKEAFVLIQDLGRRAGIELPPQEPVE